MQTIKPDPHIVIDYDFTFSNGLYVSVTVDELAGDVIDFTDPNKTIAKLVAKPSRTDPSTSNQAETITILMPHVVMINHRLREVVQPSPEDREEFQQIVQQISKHKH